jgi:hypothetical protein
MTMNTDKWLALRTAKLSSLPEVRKMNEDNRDSHECTKIWRFEGFDDIAWCPECGAIHRRNVKGSENLIIKSVPEWSRRDKLEA